MSTGEFSVAFIVILAAIALIYEGWRLTQPIYHPPEIPQSERKHDELL